jgi:hypothetical protein
MTRRSIANQPLGYPARTRSLAPESANGANNHARLLRRNAAMHHSFPRTRAALRVAFTAVGSLIAAWLMGPPSGRKQQSGFRHSLIPGGH